MMENLSARIAHEYQGNMVHSLSQKVVPVDIKVDGLNDLLVKISFKWNGEDVLFRAMLSKHDEGLLMLVQDRVTSNYILTGLSGFMYKKPSVHGGLLTNLDSFYFHIALHHFAEFSTEIYFLGKKKDSSQKETIGLNFAYKSGDGCFYPV